MATAKSNGGYIIDLCICYFKVKNWKPTNEEEIKKFGNWQSKFLKKKKKLVLVNLSNRASNACLKTIGKIVSHSLHPIPYRRSMLSNMLQSLNGCPLIICCNNFYTKCQKSSQIHHTPFTASSLPPIGPYINWPFRLIILQYFPMLTLFFAIKMPLNFLISSSFVGFKFFTLK